MDEGAKVEAIPKDGSGAEEWTCRQRKVPLDGGKRFISRGCILSTDSKNGSCN